MERPIVTVPADYLHELNISWDIDWRGQSVGDTTAGNSQVVFNAFPRWVGQPEIMLVRSQITRWRSIRAQAQGMLGIYRIAMNDPLGFDDPLLGTSINYSTGQTHSTGQGFAYDPFVTAAADAAAGATVVRVTGDRPNVGQIMSHDYWPFQVTYVDDLGSDTYDLGIQMPLRAAIASGDLIQSRGVGLFEVTEGNPGNPVYGVNRVSTVQLNFREVLSR